MKLYIKQKVFTWGDKFTVKDINGNDRYKACVLFAVIVFISLCIVNS